MGSGNSPAEISRTDTALISRARKILFSNQRVTAQVVVGSDGARISND